MQNLKFETRSETTENADPNLEHRTENRNRHDALASCFRIGFFRKPVPTFRSDAVEVRNAVTELRTAAEAHAARLAEQVTALITRLDAIEVGSQRVPQQREQAAAAETRALASFIRTGNDTEIRAAATDNNVDGGWFVLPTVDTTIRELMTDLSPMRGLAEVVTISTATLERFYSFGKRGATWTTERSDRPQDTARPELKKVTYGVAELYSAPAATRTQLEDAAIDISAWLINNVTHEFSESEGEAS